MHSVTCAWSVPYALRDRGGWWSGIIWWRNAPWNWCSFLTRLHQLCFFCRAARQAFTSMEILGRQWAWYSNWIDTQSQSWRPFAMVAEGKLFSKINWSQGISAAAFGGKVKAISADQHPEGAVLKHTTTVQHLFCSRHCSKVNRECTARDLRGGPIWTTFWCQPQLTLSDTFRGWRWCLTSWKR